MSINPQIKGALKTVAILCLLLLCLWGYVGHRTGTWGPISYFHGIDCVIGIQPIGYPLWNGSITEGYSLSRLLRSARPYRMIQYGEWTEVVFAPGCWQNDGGLLFGSHIVVLAKGDALVQATFGSCTYTREFFNGMSDDDLVDLRNAQRTSANNE